jgi:DNA-binding response OmpR family regulator
LTPSGHETLVRSVLLGSADRGRLDLLDMLLIASGYEVAQREDGQGVLKFLQTNTPDAVVLDLDLPGADGREICGRIRSITRLADVVVILISSSVAQLGGPEVLRDLVRSTSADLVLPEPVGDKNLAGRLGNLFIERDQSRLADGPSSTGHDSASSPKRRNRVAERETMTLASLDDEVRVLRAQLKAYSRGIIPVSAAIVRQKEEFERTIGELKERNESLLCDLQRERVAHEAQKSLLDEARDRLTETQAIMRDLEVQISSFEQELERRSTVEARLEGELLQAQAKLSDQEADTSSLQRRTAELHDELLAREAVNSALQERLDRAETALEDRERERMGLERRNAMLVEELERRQAEERPIREFFQRMLGDERGSSTYGAEDPSLNVSRAVRSLRGGP